MKTKFTFLQQALLLSLVFQFVLSKATAQVSMGDFHTTYYQSFDELPASGSATWESGAQYIPNWAVYRTKPANSLTANNGASNTGGLYSYGSDRTTDRALGSISSAVAGEFAYTLLLQNNTGRTINSVDLSYIGEQWRISNSTAGQHVISFYYAISSSKAAFTPSPTSDKGWTEIPAMKFLGPKYFLAGGALNGNAPDNRRLLQASLPIEIPDGHYLMLRWKDADEMEADHGLAVDDVTVTWYPEPVAEPVVLPVELVNFKARTKGAQVELAWQTASEVNNSHFIVERSADGRAFESIGMIQGQGSVAHLTKYTFLDEAPLGGTSYYRLMQVDEDDTFVYSSVAAVTRQIINAVRVFPSVTTDVLTVVADKKLKQYTVMDVMGKRLLSQDVPANEQRKHSITVSDLSNGTYVLVPLDENGQRHISRFVKK